MDGTVAVNPKTGERLVLSGGSWIPEAQAQELQKWGPGARQLPNGQIVRYGPKGGMNVLGKATIAAGSNTQSPLFMGQGAVDGLSSAERGDLTKVREAARGANSAIADANRFISLNQRTSTGGIQNNFPLLSDVTRAFTPDIQEMTSITNRLTPAQREAGSGAMSDRDVEMYRSSVLNPSNEGPVNQAVAARLKAGATRQRDYAAFLDEYAKVNGTLAGAQEKWDNYSNEHPLYDYKSGTVRSGVPTWRQYFGVQQQPRQAARPNQPTTPTKGRVSYTPAQMQAVRSIPGGPRGAGGSRTNPTMISTQAQYNRLPVGAWYIDHLGNYEQKVR